MSSTEFEPPETLDTEHLFDALGVLLPGFDPARVLSLVVSSNVVHPAPLGDPGDNVPGGLCVQVAWVDRHGRTHVTVIPVTKGFAS